MQCNRLVGEFYKPETKIHNKIRRKIIHVGTRPTDKCARILFAIFRDSFSCIVKKKTRTNDREVKFKRTIRIWEILESFCIVDMRSVLFCYLKFNATLVRFEPFVGIERKSWLFLFGYGKVFSCAFKILRDFFYFFVNRLVLSAFKIYCLEVWSGFFFVLFFSVEFN